MSIGFALQCIESSGARLAVARVLADNPAAVVGGEEESRPTVRRRMRLSRDCVVLHHTVDGGDAVVIIRLY